MIDRAAARVIAWPLLIRLGPKWMLEDEAFEGIAYPKTRAFWAVELGLAERRLKGFFRPRWHIRLTEQGWAEQ